MGQNQLNRLLMVLLECPRVRNPCISFAFEEFPFPISAPAPFFLPLSLWGNKKWFIMGGWVKRWNIYGTKSAQEAANGPGPGQKPLYLIPF